MSTTEVRHEDRPAEPTEDGKFPLVFTLIAQQSGLELVGAEVRTVETGGRALRPSATGIRATATYGDGTWSNPIPPNEAFRLTIDRALLAELADQPGPVLQLAVHVKTESEHRTVPFYFFHPATD